VVEEIINDEKLYNKEPPIRVCNPVITQVGRLRGPPAYVVLYEATTNPSIIVRYFNCMLPLVIGASLDPRVLY
jgi:hypothetical protein